MDIITIYVGESLLFQGCLTLSQTTNFRLFKMKEFPDHNIKFDENVREFSKQVENTEGKGEIAHDEQFLLFSQYFPKTCTAGTGLFGALVFWEWVKLGIVW